MSGLVRGGLAALALALACGVLAVQHGVASDASEKRSAPERQPSGKTNNISFDDLKFDIEKGAKYDPAMLTPRIQELVGQRVRVRGYILPSTQQTLVSFTLVRDNKECCFGPKAALYDCIRVKMTPEKTANFTTLPIAVEGLFSLKELKIGDQTWALFFIDADEAK